MTVFLRWLSALVLVGLLALAAAPFTDVGTRLLVQALDRYSPLAVGYGGGRLGGRLQLGYVALTTESLVLRIDAVQAELNPGCLWRSAFCFHRLEIGNLDLEILPGESADDAVAAGDAKPAAALQLPVQVEADTLVLGAATIRWPGGRWEQGVMEASVRVGGDAIEVGEASVRGARLSIAPSDTEPTGEPVILPAIDLPLRLAVDDLHLVGPAFDIAGVQRQLEYLQLRGRWRGQELELAEVAAAAPAVGALTASGHLSFSGNWPLQLTSEVTFSEPPEWAAPLGSAATVHLSGDLGGLRLEATGGGPADLALEGVLETLQPGLPFRLAVRAAWSETLTVAQLAPVSGAAGEVELLSPLALSAEGTLAQQSFTLTGSAAGLGYGAMSVALNGSQRDGRIAVSEFAVRDADAHNALRASGEVTVADGAGWSLHIASEGFDLPRITGYAVVGRLRGALGLSGTVGAGAWQLAVEDAEIAGEVNGLPASVSGYAALGSDLTFGPSDLLGDVNGARLALRAGGDAGGMLDIRVEDLGRWIPGGRGLLTLGATSPGLGRAVAVSGTLRELDLGQVAIDAGSLSGHYRPAQDHGFDLRTELTGVSLLDAELESVRFNGRGDASSQAFSLALAGDVSGELNLAGGSEQRGWRGVLDATAIDTPQGAWQLEQPVAITQAGAPGAPVTVAAHCWENRGTRFCPGELQLAARSRGSIEVAGDMGFLELLFPDEVDVAGTLDLAVDFAWGGGEPLFLQGGGESRGVRIVRRFGAGDEAAITWERAVARLEQRPDGLHLEGELLDGGARKIGLALQLPVDREQGALQGLLEFDRLQLANLAPLVPNLSRLEGELGGRVELSGTVDDPRAQGVIRMTGGRVAVLGNPTELASLDLSLDLEGDRAGLSGRGLLGGGDIGLDGSLRLSPEPRLEMTVTGSRQQLLAPPATELLVSETLQVVLADGLLDVAGEIVVHEGTLRQEDLPEGSVDVSDRVVVVDYAGNVIEEERPFDTRLDLRVRIEDRFLVEGSGLRATVGGNLQVVQQRGRPLQLFGTLNVVGGEIEAYRQRLVIRRGSVSFAGAPGNPELNVRAERTIRADNVTVGVELLGTLEEPVMTVYSDPPMEQSEAMSYLIRGRGMDTGAAADGTALAVSMGASVVNQSGVLSGFDRLPGISQVEFGTEGSAEETAATVGGYIGDRIYLSYGIGIYEPIAVITARLYLSARLWLEVVSRLENSADLYYSFEIH